MKKIYLYVVLTLVFCNAGFAEKDLVINESKGVFMIWYALGAVAVYWYLNK